MCFLTVLRFKFSFKVMARIDSASLWYRCLILAMVSIQIILGEPREIARVYQLLDWYTFSRTSLIDMVHFCTKINISDPTMSNIILSSVLTCPQCGFVRQETMPTDACLFYYQCTSCMVLLKPKSGDCCVFCSFGSVKCPPIQQQKGCCG